MICLECGQKFPLEQLYRDDEDFYCHECYNRLKGEGEIK